MKVTMLLSPGKALSQHLDDSSDLYTESSRAPTPAHVKPAGREGGRKREREIKGETEG